MGVLKSPPFDPKILTGNSVTVFMGTLLVATAQNFRWDTPFGTKQFHGIGTPAPIDIVQLISDPALTVDYFRLTHKGINFLGSVDIVGFLNGNKFDITVLAGGLLGGKNAANSGGPLATFVYCVADTASTNVVANEGVIQTISFKAASVMAPDGTYLTPQSPFLR